MSLGTLVFSFNHVLLVILWFISLRILSSRFLWSQIVRLPMCEWEICVCASVCICAHTCTCRLEPCVGPSLVTFHVAFWVRVSLTPDLSSWQVWLDRERASPVSTQLWGGICGISPSSVCVLESQTYAAILTQVLYQLSHPPNLDFLSFYGWIIFYFLSYFIYPLAYQRTCQLHVLTVVCSNEQVNTDNTSWYWFLFFIFIYVYFQARLLGYIFPFWGTSIVLSIVTVSVFIQKFKDAFVIPGSIIPVSITAILTDLW